MKTSEKQKSYSLQKFLIWAAIVPLGIFAVFIIAAALSDILTGNYVIHDDPASGKTTLGILIGMGLCAGLLPAVFTVMLVRRLIQINRLEKRQTDVAFQDGLLELAKRLGGKLTVLEVSTELNLSVSESNEALNRFVSMGLARLQVSESGVLVFHFDQFISGDEKNRAETV